MRRLGRLVFVAVELGPDELAVGGRLDAPVVGDGGDDRNPATPDGWKLVGDLRGCGVAVLDLDAERDVGPGVPGAHLPAAVGVLDHVGDHLRRCQSYGVRDHVVGVVEQWVEMLAGVSAGVGIVVEAVSDVRFSIVLSHTASLPARASHHPFPGADANCVGTRAAIPTAVDSIALCDPYRPSPVTGRIDNAQPRG